MAAGYSGTPLVKKLGVKDDMVLYVESAPTEYSALLGELPSATSKNCKNSVSASAFLR